MALWKRTTSVELHPRGAQCRRREACDHRGPLPEAVRPIGQRQPGAAGTQAAETEWAAARRPPRAGAPPSEASGLFPDSGCCDRAARGALARQSHLNRSLLPPIRPASPPGPPPGAAPDQTLHRAAPQPKLGLAPAPQPTSPPLAARTCAAAAHLPLGCPPLLCRLPAPHRGQGHQGRAGLRTLLAGGSPGLRRLRRRGALGGVHSGGRALAGPAALLRAAAGLVAAPGR